jgi:hypothetical protein
MSDKKKHVHQAAIDNRTPPGVFHIAFDTRATPGYIRSVKVTIEVDMLPDDHMVADKSLMARYRVDLCDHPLYADLQRYVKANPR